MKKMMTLALMLTVLWTIALAAQEKKSDDGDAAKQTATAKEPTAAKEADVPAQNVSTPAGDEYVIGPEDALHISVWKEPELSGQVSVRPDGKISMALLNDVQAAGLTPMQLRDQIRDRLKQYVTDPQVTVTVTAMNSRRIFLIGEFARAGAFPMLPHMTLMQALSSAGGFSQYANVKKMYLLRTENGKQTKMPINYKALISGSAPEQNIQLKPGDTIVVP